MEKEELFKELTEIEEVKLPLVMQKLQQAREQGNLSGSPLCEEARNEQMKLVERIREIKDIITRKDCDELVDSMRFFLFDDSLNDYLKNVRDFYKKHHEGEEYFIEEATILFYLNLLRSTYLTKGLEEPAEIIFNLQEEILGLTKENGDKEINILCGYWDKLIAKTKDLGKDLFKYDLRKTSNDEHDEYFKPLLNLIYSTGIYFVNQKSGGKKTLKHSELFLINHLYISFLTYLNPRKDSLNVYYYVLDALLEAVAKGEFENRDWILIVIGGHGWSRDVTIPFKTIKEFERNIYSLQLLLWDIETELDEYTKENLESFKNESLNYLEEWSKEDK
ncbi:MAG: hypothetical protein SO007_01340 [Candidatus Enteromonas sp.]|nr:hypothetical protein [Candidatus Enteromonas sp.]